MIKKEHDALCSNPSDKVISEVKGDKAAKAAGKRAAATTIAEDMSSRTVVTTVYVPPTKAKPKWTIKENRACLASTSFVDYW